MCSQLGHQRNQCKSIIFNTVCQRYYCFQCCLSAHLRLLMIYLDSCSSSDRRIHFVYQHTPMWLESLTLITSFRIGRRPAMWCRRLQCNEHVCVYRHHSFCSGQFYIAMPQAFQLQSRPSVLPKLVHQHMPTTQPEQGKCIATKPDTSTAIAIVDKPINHGEPGHT